MSSAPFQERQVKRCGPGVSVTVAFTSVPVAEVVSTDAPSMSTATWSFSELANVQLASAPVRFQT